MKKTILMVFAALLLAVPAVQAQKVNRTAITEKITKSDEEIADAKKAAKSSTWINRGKAFYEAAVEPTKNLFVNMDAAMLKLAVGEPTSRGEETVGDKSYETWVYPYFVGYVKDGKLVTWKQTKFIVKDAVAKSLEAYAKAAELDPKAAPKVKEGLKQLADYCLQVGNAGIDSGDFVGAAKAFAEAYKVQSSPAYNEPESVLLYYAGYLYTMDGAKNPKSFVEGEKYLQQALKAGYTDPEGFIYYYLFHCYYGQKDVDPANITKAKDILLVGIEKSPKNERILDGLMQLYTSEKGVGDPADLVSLIDKAIAENPTNADLWFGRGRIFYALKNYDESAASFAKVVEMKPDNFEANFFLGYVYSVKGDALNAEFNEKPYNDSTYESDLKTVNAVYMQALPWFEKALQLKPEDPDTVEITKQLCFRLRDEPGIQEKYEVYNALYKKIKGIE